MEWVEGCAIVVSTMQRFHLLLPAVGLLLSGGAGLCTAAETVNHAPVAEPSLVVVLAGEIAHWRPMVSDLDKDPLKCTLLPSKFAFYGAMTLKEDCSEGVYLPPNDRIVGLQCRQFVVSDGTHVTPPIDICIRIIPREKVKPHERVTPRPRPGF